MKEDNGRIFLGFAFYTFLLNPPKSWKAADSGLAQDPAVCNGSCSIVTGRIKAWGIGPLIRMQMLRKTG